MAKDRLDAFNKGVAILDAWNKGDEQAIQDAQLEYVDIERLIPDFGMFRDSDGIPGGAWIDKS